jgi:hypothetical protein
MPTLPRAAADNNDFEALTHASPAFLSEFFPPFFPVIGIQ